MHTKASLTIVLLAIILLTACMVVLSVRITRYNAAAVINGCDEGIPLDIQHSENGNLLISCGKKHD